MTRRTIAWRCEDGTYILSQEFNGDRNESRRYGLDRANQLKINWPTVAAIFNGVKDESGFKSALSIAEKLYGYSSDELLTASAELPGTQEVWLVKDGKLTLVSRYGEPVPDMSGDSEYYALNEEVAQSLHKMKDGRVFQMLDIAYLPIPWESGRHNYTNPHFQREVGDVTEFMPTFGNERPIATAMIRIK